MKIKKKEYQRLLDAKICDNPNHIGDFISRIFSDSDPNWASGVMGVHRMNQRTGIMEVKEVSSDSCPRCMGTIDIRKKIMEDEIQKEIEAGLQARYGLKDTRPE